MPVKKKQPAAVREQSATSEFSKDQLVEFLREMLRIRRSSKLFRLETGEEIQQRVRFLNAESGNPIAGLIVMMISDEGLAEVDPHREVIVVVFNGSGDSVQFSHELLKEYKLALHPVQQDSVDAIVRQTAFDAETGTLTVPARTTAVFQDATAIPPVRKS